MAKQGRYEAIFEYVRALLESVDGVATKSAPRPFRRRSEHIWRVYKWTRRLADGIHFAIDEDALFTAALFHDSGYALSPNGSNHAQNGAEVFAAWARGEPYPARGAAPLDVKLCPQRIKVIESLIANHSNKALLREYAKSTYPGKQVQNVAVSPELVLLMEADLLDETGAMSIAWDCMEEGTEDKQSYAGALKRTLASGGGVADANPLVTPRAREYWKEKTALWREFTSQLARDIALGDETLSRKN